MAEVLGAVASGIAVLQVSASILKGSRKLRSAWSQFQDTPRDIEHVLEEMEILGQTLALLEPAISHAAHDDDMVANVVKCLGLCQRAIGELDDLAVRFPFQPDRSRKRQLALKWKVYYCRDEIINIRERLHRAVRYLSLAVTCYSISMPSSNPQLIEDVSAQDISSIPSPPNDNATSTTSGWGEGEEGTHQERQKSLPSNWQKTTRRACLSLGLATYVRESKSQHLPWKSDQHASGELEDQIVEEWKLVPAAWSRVHGICLRWTKSFGNWQYLITSFRVVEDDHAVFSACAEGNIQQMIRLLSMRTAALSDVNEEGHSLLHVASQYNQPEMCKWLLKQGTEIDTFDNRGLTPLHHSALCYYRQETCRDTLKALLQDGLADATINIGGTPMTTAFHVFHGPVDAFSYLQQAMETSFDEQVDYTLSWQCGKCYGSGPTKYAKAAFDKLRLSPARAAYTDHVSGVSRTILHAAAANTIDLVDCPDDRTIVLQILDQVLALSVPLHPRDEFEATPLDYLCYGSHHSTTPDPATKSKHAIDYWLRAVHARGIDLEAYLEEEFRLHPGGILIHPMQRRMGLVRRFSWERRELAAAEGGLSISVWDENAAGPAIAGSWPPFEDGDDREIVYDAERMAEWTLEFKPVVCEVV